MKSLFKKKAKKERQRTTRKGWDDYREDAYYNDDYEDSDEYYEDEEDSEEYYEDEETGYYEDEDSDEYYSDEETDEDSDEYLSLIHIEMCIRDRGGAYVLLYMIL